MLLHLFLLISLPVLVVISLLSYIFKNRNVDHVPPGPPGLPLIGNIHQLAKVKCAMHLHFWQLSKKYGALIHMKLGPKPVIVVSSARLAKQVMKTQDLAFCSRPQQLAQQVMSYNSTDIIFSPYNEYWREVRKIAVVNLFSLKKFHSFRPVREDEVARLVAKVSGFASSSGGNRVVNLSEMATSLGISLICRIAFGKRYDEHGFEMRRFDGLFQEMQGLGGARVYASDYFPRLGYWVDKLNGSLGRVDAVFKNLDAFYQELIDEHLVRTKKVDDEEGDDILDVLIKLKQHKAPCSVDLTWDNVKALLLDIFAAATDTSAVAIVWTMTAVIKAPHVMQKVQAELRNIIGNKGRVDEDDLPKLGYLKAVINEAFRLYPPVPLVQRETIERCTLDGYEIQPGTLVYINVWAIARDPEYWENSPHEFLPERFVNSDIDIKGQDFGVIPFGSGRRACPGMLMGLANVELAVANLLYSFDWELPDGIQAKDVDTEALPGLSVHKKNPLLLVPKKYIF